MKQNLLSHFFDNPSMWFWALVMIAVMSVAVFHLSEIYVSGMGLRIPISDFISSSSEDNNSFTSYIGAHLLPYGIKFRSKGETISSNISSDFSTGILILAVCIIGVVIATKRSSNAISVLGPYWIYSIISLFFVVSSLNRQFGGGVRLDLIGLPCLIPLIVTSLITAVICRTIIRYSVNQGWISGIDSYSDESIQINPAIINQVNRVAGQVGQIAGNILESGAVMASGRLVGRNIRCCPFCGSVDFTAVKPHPYGCECNACGRIVGALEEQSGESNKCPVCPSGLVKGAKFCHRCGTFLENYITEPKLNETIQSNFSVDASKKEFRSFN